jgi:hypothetical protein
MGGWTTQGIYFSYELFHQLPLMPSLCGMPLASIVSVLPKLNPKSNLESNHVVEDPTTTQNYYTYGNENAPPRPT